MTYRVEITARAASNFRTLYRVISARNAPQAHACFNELEAVVANLAEHPGRCPPTPEDSSRRHRLYGANPMSTHHLRHR